MMYSDGGGGSGGGAGFAYAGGHYGWVKYTQYWYSYLPENEGKKITYTFGERDYYKFEWVEGPNDAQSSGVEIVVQRIKETDEYTLGTFSVDNGKITGYTLERSGPSSRVEDSKKRIEAGTYNLVAHSGKNFQNVWRLENVPGREGILIHNGSYPYNTTGCILFGFNNPMDGMINESVNAINELRTYFNIHGVQGATITIYDIINP
ncbi:MAG TPA: DUF5675 family protein [Atribacterota bacterium]|nr:DUF5675 family protein [Atribacterota bacterium]